MESILRHIPFRGRPPILLKVRSSDWFITLAVCIAVFTDVFLYGVIVPVFPFALRDRAHVSPQDVQHWVSVLLAVYGAALIVASPICGILADRSPSRRTPLLAGLVVLAGSTLMLCFGTSIGVLIAGRLLQGASAAVVWTVALALLADTVRADRLGRVIGLVSVSNSLGVLVAPLLGGVVYERSGYYAVFGLTFAVIGLDIILRLLLIEKKIAAKWLDGEVPQTAGTIPNQNLDDIPLDDLSVQSRLRPDQKPKRKLPPILILLKSKRILAAVWASMAVSAMLTAFDTVLPLFVHGTFGWNSLGAGLIFLALVVPSFASPVFGYLTDKYGPRWIAASGLIMSLPFWVLLRLVDHDSIGQIILLCALLACLGTAIAIVLTPLMTEFSKVCDAKEKQQPGLFGARSAYAQSFGLFNVAWAAGALIGPLWAAGVQSRVGWKTMTWTLGVLSAISAVPVILYSGGLITRRKTDRQPTEEI